MVEASATLELQADVDLDVERRRLGRLLNEAAFVKGSFGDGPRAASDDDLVSSDVLDVKTTSKDWTTHACSAPLRNQGQCGSCWASATVVAAESWFSATTSAER
ncbi:hypothetical protein SDRG_08674 [Saprolegnia diclina VS20]|uniref:Peptidase C1A papain C-terminal domain-containing protein n=1 Tax=Saprolegnia diclina (strain VS20) TaxID=1156394 RepID=T0QJT1_SAPDV|nr:hypothetical protein SDRG_08674 [Saprolegnia diclina VS20]EQC33995.1 hypothetical protein SDRG_08674 [Saprolegnia diclina VS20]|eukprot:XP_008612790.1 hypothetical protein SDRG_08674 [Saprolegnia diclina VS20]